MAGAAPQEHTGKGGKKALDAELNLVPFIDLLSCCISFLLITAVWTQIAGLQVSSSGGPPEQQSKQKVQASSQIVLELKGDGSYAINGQPYSLNQLEQAFHQIYDPRPAKLLFIKAAPTRKYLDVMQAMDIAHGAGVQVIGFTPPTPGK